jgi:hypothetical protein
MADSTNTTVLVLAAAAVVVAVMWSRRASAAPAGSGAAGRLPSGPAQPSGPDYAGILQGAGSFFAGLADLSDSFSSDEDSVYTIPDEPAFDAFQDCGGPGQISCEELEAQQNVYDITRGR